MRNLDKWTALADHLDNGNLTKFNMQCYAHCAVGQWIRLQADKDGVYLDEMELRTEAQKAVTETFGVVSGTPDWDFAFGSRWGNSNIHEHLNDPHAAADRLRYMVRHGGCPDPSQWNRFETPEPRPAKKTYEVEKLVCVA